VLGPDENPIFGPHGSPVICEAPAADALEGEEPSGYLALTINGVVLKAPDRTESRWRSKRRAPNCDSLSSRPSPPGGLSHWAVPGSVARASRRARCWVTFRDTLATRLSHRYKKSLQIMWPGQDSNLRATDYESAALTN
jgi:hypothetical protein